MADKAKIKSPKELQAQVDKLKSKLLEVQKKIAMNEENDFSKVNKLRKDIARSLTQLSQSALEPTKTGVKNG